MWWMPLAMAAPLGPGTVAVGQELHITHHVVLEVDLDVRLLGSRRQERIWQQQHQRYQLTQLEDGLSLTWTENRHWVDQPGHAHDRVLPVVGHTYLSGAGLRRSDGVAVSEEEASIVGQVSTVSMLTTLRQMLPSTVDVGQVVPAGPMFAGMLDAAPGEPALRSGSLTVAAVADGAASVDLALVLTSSGTDARGAEVDCELTLSGTLVLDLESGQVRRFEVSGPLTVAARRTGLVTTGHGTFHSLTVLDPQ